MAAEDETEVFLPDSGRLTIWRSGWESLARQSSHCCGRTSPSPSHEGRPPEKVVPRGRRAVGRVEEVAIRGLVGPPASSSAPQGSFRQLTASRLQPRGDHHGRPVSYRACATSIACEPRRPILDRDD